MSRNNLHKFTPSKLEAVSKKRKSRNQNSTLSSRHRLQTYSYNQRMLQTLENDSQKSEQNTTNTPFKSNKQDFASNKQSKGRQSSNFSPPSFRQQKQFFKHFENQNSRRPSFRSGGTIDPYSPDVAPMNIFENQVIPTGMHNLSKIFRPNLATLRVISLGMKFIPKSNTLKWRNMFSNFEKFRQRMNNKMFFFVENAPGTFIRKLFG